MILFICLLIVFFALFIIGMLTKYGWEDREGGERWLDRIEHEANDEFERIAST